MTDLGLASLYETSAPRSEQAPLADVTSSDWRNILVLGRATKTGVYPETLALVGRARYMADELGCRVEVLLIGSRANLDAATKELQRYPLDTVYRVEAPDYAPIDHTAKILEAVVRKRRPELILVFQSRTGDAVTAYAANRLGVGFVTGASRIDIDTSKRLAVVTHESSQRFQIVTAMQVTPQFVSVQRGLFRAPLEDTANVRVHDLEIEVGRLAAIKVGGHRPPIPPEIARAERVVVAGARIRSPEELQLARDLAKRLDAVFGVTLGIVERGFASDDPVVGVDYHRIAPRLLVTVGVRGALDFLDAVDGHPTICAVGSEPEDPVAKRAAYLVAGGVKEAVTSVLDAL